MYVMSFPVSYTADRLVNSGRFRTITIRKLFTIMGLIGPSLSLVWLAFVGCNSTQAILALCLASGLNSGKYAGTQMSFYDMSPNYAGTILGIANTAGSATGFISPIVTGALTQEVRILEKVCNGNRI
jgi:MFS family permease